MGRPPQAVPLPPRAPRKHCVQMKWLRPIRWKQAPHHDSLSLGPVSICLQSNHMVLSTSVASEETIGPMTPRSVPMKSLSVASSPSSSVSLCSWLQRLAYNVVLFHVSSALVCLPQRMMETAAKAERDERPGSADANSAESDQEFGTRSSQGAPEVDPQGGGMFEQSSADADRMIRCTPPANTAPACLPLAGHSTGGSHDGGVPVKRPPVPPGSTQELLKTRPAVSLSAACAGGGEAGAQLADEELVVVLSQQLSGQAAPEREEQTQVTHTCPARLPCHVSHARGSYLAVVWRRSSPLSSSRGGYEWSDVSLRLHRSKAHT